MSGSLNPSALARLLGEWNLGAAPAYRELADVVRLLVLDGRIPLDVALPSERALAATLGVSRTTVTAAYARLREQGFLSSGQGSRGRTLHARAAHVPLARSGDPAGCSGAPGLAVPRRAPGPCLRVAARQRRSGAPGLCGATDRTAGAAARLRLRRPRRAGPPRGDRRPRIPPPACPPTAGQILVTSGAQHALNIVLRTLAAKQDKVLVEHPSYPNALDAIRAAGCRIVPVPLPPASERGWDLDSTESALTQHRPRMAYTVPDFHNPTGRLMPDGQRRRLVRAAAASGTVLVVDETLRELNLDGGTTAPLASFSPAVVSIGSLSKSHWAGMRTGWIRASESLVQRFAAVRTTMDLGGPVVEQLAAAHLVRSLADPLPARLSALRENRSALLALLEVHLPRWEAEWPDGGLAVWCRLPSPSSTALTVIAPELGIRLAAGPRFGVGGVFENFLRIPFTLPPDQLETAVLALRAAQDRLDAAPQLRRTLRDSPAAAIA